MTPAAVLDRPAVPVDSAEFPAGWWATDVGRTVAAALNFSPVNENENDKENDPR